MKPNEIQKAFRKKRNDTSQSWVPTTSSAMSSQSDNSTAMQETPSSIYQQQQRYCNLPRQHCGQENSSAGALQEQPIYTAWTTTQQHQSFPPVSANTLSTATTTILFVFVNSNSTTTTGPSFLRTTFSGPDVKKFTPTAATT